MSPTPVLRVQKYTKKSRFQSSNRILILQICIAWHRFAYKRNKMLNDKKGRIYDKRELFPVKAPFQNLQSYMKTALKKKKSFPFSVAQL